MRKENDCNIIAFAHQNNRFTYRSLCVWSLKHFEAWFLPFSHAHEFDIYHWESQLNKKQWWYFERNEILNNKIDEKTQFCLINSQYFVIIPVNYAESKSHLLLFTIHSFAFALTALLFRHRESFFSSIEWRADIFLRSYWNMSPAHKTDLWCDCLTPFYVAL